MQSIQDQLVPSEVRLLHYIHVRYRGRGSNTQVAKLALHPASWLAMVGSLNYWVQDFERVER